MVAVPAIPEIEIGDDLHLVRLHDDPVFHARVAFGIDPTDQQTDFLNAIAKPGARVSVRSGHGTGKSTSLAMSALWFLNTHEDALVPCTAPTAHQLQDVLWRELYGLHSRMPDEMKREIIFNSERIRRIGSKGAIIPRTARPENPDALQGFHAANILFVIEEASGVANAIFEVARGALSTPGARVAMAGNPTRLSGYFYDSFHARRDSWNRLRFSCLDSPLVSPEYPREMREEYGEDSDIYRVRVLGEFPKGGEMAVIRLEDVEAAMARTLPRHFDNPAAKIMGIDLALEGADRTSIIIRQGVYARVAFAGRVTKAEQLVALVCRYIDEERPDRVFADKGGMGAPIVHLVNANGYSVQGINFGGAPGDAERFVRRREEMWWSVREWLERDDPVIERNDDLRDDLVAPEYCTTAAGKIQLESKELMRRRGLASPDLGDALALTFAVRGAENRILPHHADRTRYSDFGTDDAGYSPLQWEGL